MTTSSRELRVTQDGVPLVGTLLLPDRKGPVPAALLITGSGPIDRDSDHKRLPLGVTRLLAEALAEAGIASLRFDKRGAGHSGGEFLSAGLHDNTDDARAMLAALRDQPEVDADRVVVIGHSEGSFHAATIASDAEVEPLAGVALLSGAGRSGAEVLQWQAAAIAPTLPAPVRFLLRLLRVDLVKKNAKTVAKVRATTKDVQRVGGQRMNAKWFREFVDTDPREPLGRATVPVLAVTGTKDLQAPPQDVDAIGAVVPGPFEGHVVDDVNHILRVETDAPSVSRYKKQVDQPLAPGVRRILVDWAGRVTA